MTRWDAFSDDELRDLDRAFSVDDQEYGVDSPLWAEIRGELLRRAFERMLRDSYAPALSRYLNSPRLSWLESDAAK